MSMEIATGLHRIECPIGDRFVAVHAIVGARHIAVVDTGYEGSVESEVLPYFDAHGLERERVRFIIITHADYDHSGGAETMRAAFPNAMVCAGESDRAQLEDLERMINERYGEFAADHHFSESPEAEAFIREVAGSTRIDVGLTGGERLNLGGRYLEILHAPGHSPGHVAVLDEESRIVVLGDAVLGDTVALADGSPAFPPTYRSVDSYRATIRNLKGRNPAAISPAHAPVLADGDAQGFLDLSLAYADRVEAVALDVVTSSTRALGLLEIIGAGHERLGVWPEPAYFYLVYPVLGHLEVLERRGLIASRRDSDGLVRWVAA